MDIHWARNRQEAELLRELESQKPHDSLSKHEHDSLREKWDEQMSNRLAALDSSKEFGRADREWTEADALGNPVAGKTGTSSEESH